MNLAQQIIAAAAHASAIQAGLATACQRKRSALNGRGASLKSEIPARLPMAKEEAVSVSQIIAALVNLPYVSSGISSSLVSLLNDNLAVRTGVRGSYRYYRKEAA